MTLTRNLEPERRLSPSALSSAETCLKRLEFKLEGWRGDGSEATAEGSGYHAGLEQYYRDRKEDPTLFHPTPDLIDRYIEAAHQGLIEAILPHQEEDAPPWTAGQISTYIKQWDGWDGDTWATANEKVDLAIRRYFENTWQMPKEYLVHDVEAAVSIDLGIPGWTASKGFIDVVFWLPDPGEFVLVDHKTASRMWNADKNTVLKVPQAGYYPIAWEQITGLRPTWTYFDIQTWAGKFERRGISSVDAMTTIYKLENLAQAADALQEKGIPFPANPSSNLCSPKYCDYWTICPYGGLKESS